MPSPRVNIRLIVSVSIDQIIGINNKIPWHNPRELKLFKEITTNKKYTLDYGHYEESPSIIMGRKTFESIGRTPLPNRLNIVISRRTHVNTTSNTNDVVFVNTIEESIKVNGHRNGFVIGGSEIYKQFLRGNYCGYMFISQMKLHVLPEITDSIVYWPITDAEQYKLKSILETNEEFTLKLFQHVKL